MGDPRNIRKCWEAPKKLSLRRIKEEDELAHKYGLRRKREQWRAHTDLRRLREAARSLLARRDEAKETELLARVRRLGLIGKSGKLDQVLELTVEDLLKRRIQTLVLQRGLANSPRHARQLIVHGKVWVGDRVIRWPSFLVPSELESRLRVD